MPHRPHYRRPWLCVEFVILIFNPWRAFVLALTHPVNQGQRSGGSKVTMETDEQA